MSPIRGTAWDYRSGRATHQFRKTMLVLCFQWLKRYGGSSMSDQRVEDAFNSMLRADYIPLKDIGKLNLLAEYYVDYYGFLSQILSENDQLIVGRRGTGKTTL